MAHAIAIASMSKVAGTTNIVALQSLPRFKAGIAPSQHVQGARINAIATRAGSEA